MSKIFISHSSQDNAKALALVQWLESNGWDDYFLDITPSRGLSPGERWQEALKIAADRCEAVVLLISPAWRDSKWCLAEFLQARQLGKPVFGVIVESTPRDSLPKEMTAEWQLCDLVTGEERECFHVFQDQIVSPTDVSLAGIGLAKLKQGLEKAGLDPSFFPWPPPNDPCRSPYRGLKALEAEDAAVFFGREAPLILALDTLRCMKASGEQFFVILGASGAGKSSFLRAGLWPRLRRDDRHFLPLPVLRPERAAINGQSGLVESLEKAFHEYKMPKTRARIQEILTIPGGLIDLLVEIQTLAQKKLSPGAELPTVVLSIDQAEELFSKEENKEEDKEQSKEAEQLLTLISKLLGPAARERHGDMGTVPRVMVLVTIRSDSYERLQTASALAGIRQTPFSLPPLAQAEYKMVIEGPAARWTDPKRKRKLTIEPILTEQLVKDAEGSADALPLLAFILERLFILERKFIDNGVDGHLSLKKYNDMGGPKGPIEAAIQEAWAEPNHDPVISADEATRRTHLHQAFPKLVMLDHATEVPKRRVAAWDEVPPEALPLLERLVTKRLLLKDRRKLEGGQEAVVVEVAHEALIRHWSQLKDWVEANREFLLWRGRLSSRVIEWQHSKNKEDKGLLLQGRLLEEAQGWFSQKADMLTDQEQYFIKYSWEAHEQAVQAERKRAEAATRTRRRLWLFGLAVPVFLLGGLAVTWLWQTGYNLQQAVLKIQSVFVSIHVSPEMVPIPGGRFEMGHKDSFKGSGSLPVHPVTIMPFAMGKYEVTFEEYDRFAIAMDQRCPEDAGMGRGKRPVIFVSWDEAKAYAEWLSKQTGERYRLPTESEWEYAARSGGINRDWSGTDDVKKLIEYAVYNKSAIDARTQPVGKKTPNAFHLYDMSGNVKEWVEDCVHKNYENAPKDGSAWLEADDGICTFRMARGGTRGGTADDVRVTYRATDKADSLNREAGFRLAQDLP